jgi:hypothetical protein
MRSIARHIALTTIWLLAHAIAFAQAPPQVSYQATLRDHDGRLVVSAPVGLRISILEGAADGPALSVELHKVQSNAHGIVTLKIGDASGSLAGIDWTKGPYFLKAEFDPGGGTNYRISVITELLAVPYALFAPDPRVEGPEGPTGPAGPTGPQGAEGARGAGIEGVTDDGIGVLTFHFDDGSTYVTPVLTGPQGPAGAYDLSPYLKAEELATGVPNNERDVVFTGTAAAQVTVEDISNWDKTFSWGDHSQGGYLKTETQDLADILGQSADGAGHAMENISKVVVGATERDASAILEIANASKGFLIPRMTGAQRFAIENPVEGLMIYNTNQKKLQYFDGGAWQDINIR